MNRGKRAEGRSWQIDWVVESSIILDENFDGDSSSVSRRRELGLHLLPLRLIPAVLEPDLDLSLRQFQRLR